MKLSTSFSLKSLAAVFWTFFCQNAFLQAQCPQASFTAPDTVCIGEPVNIANTSTGAVRYEWDFCSGDLEQVPQVRPVVTISGANIPTNLTTVFDGENWFGFFFSRDNNTLFRLDFGNDLNNTPTVVNVGAFGNPVSRPEPLAFVKEGNNWYAFTSNFSIPSNIATSKLIRLDFGTSLLNAPTIADLGNPNNSLSVVRSIRVERENGDYIMVLTNTGSGTVAIINLGSSVTNAINSANVLVTPAFPGSNNRLISTSVIKDCDTWYGITTSETNGKLYRLRFGTSLFSVPQITEIQASVALSFPTLSVLLRDQNYYAIVPSELGNVYVVNFGQSMQNTPSIRNLGDFSVLSNSYGFTVAQTGSDFVGFSLGYLNRQVSRINFPSSCGVEPSTANGTNPTVTFAETGTRQATLKVFNASGDVNVTTRSVFVRPNLTAAFTATNTCLGQPVAFAAPANPAGNRAVSYTWDFGNGGTASGRSVQQTFATAGGYNVTLTVRDVCGRTVAATQTIQITSAPVADFAAPAGACSNQTLAFADASSANNDPIVSWEWDFGDGTTATDPNATHAFAQAGSRTVTLAITGQSGCRTTVSKTVNLQEGANVTLSFAQTCLGGPTRFRDETQGTGLTGRTWDFGDNGATSAEANPSHTYAQPGTYLVKLTVQNSTGCAVTRTQSVTIRRPPQAAFTSALACSGESTQFADGSTGNDGNIARWQWNFGDAASGANNTSEESNPRHVFASPGTYQVKLKVTTIFGCADSVTRAVTVAAAPRAAFSFQANCTGTEAVFTDASQPPTGGSITAWYWEFGDNGTPSTERSPRYRYAVAGTYKVRLTVTSANRCTNTSEQTVTAGGLSLRMMPDTAVCAGVETVFSAQVGTNEQVTWQWDFGSLGKFTIARPTVTVPANQSSLSVTVTATTASGCSATLTRSLPVRRSPEAQFVYEVSSGNPLSVTFNNRSVNGSRYAWDFGESGATSSATNPTHTYAQPGLYEVSLRAVQANGCTSVATQTVLIGVAGSDRLAVLPNPHNAGQSGDVRLVFRLVRQQAVLLEIHDLTGRQLAQATLQNTREGMNTVQLSDVLQAPLAKGLYVIVMQADNIRQVCKMVVQ